VPVDEQTIVALIAVGVFILVGFPVHEFSHAWAAYKLGDSTARYQGRLTLNPRVHIDPLGSAVLAISALFFSVFIGWAKPTPVNPFNLRYGRRGESMVAVAGPLSNLVMAAAVAIPLRLIWSDLQLVVTVAGSLPLALIHDTAWWFVLINVFLFMFNLLPIPPLDGWKVLTGLLDARLAFQLRQVEPYGLFLLLGVVLIGGRFIVGIAFSIFNVLTGGAQQVGLSL
jgi:Zn-dependent protease